MASELAAEIGIWLSAIMILAVYSWLYKYSVLFKIAEYSMIGTAAGYLFVRGYENVINTSVTGLQAGNYWQIIPIILGITLFLRYVKDYAWIQRYGTSYLVAGTLVIYFRATIVTQVTQQIQSTINFISLATPMSIINSIILVATLIGVLFYFIFTVRYSTNTPGYNFINKIGRYGFLTALGYYLGITVMTRVAFVANRLQFLLFEWLNLVPPA